MNLEDIQQAIAKLSPEDRAKLRFWLAEFEAGQAECEPETKASKLARLAGRAVAVNRPFNCRWLSTPNRPLNSVLIPILLSDR